MFMHVKNLLLVFLCLFPVLGIGASKIRVACIGNSITFGAGISERENNSYPAQLQLLLGERYEVRNWGVSGTTVLFKGDSPYVNTSEYIQSKAFQPDIVLIKLGTNDTKPQNWKYNHSFMDDYQRLIDAYKALDSHPRIILLTPVRCFLSEDAGISSQLIESKVRPMIEELAWKNHLEIINLFNLFGDKWDGMLMPDRLHPSSVGAQRIALKIGRYLQQSGKDNEFVPSQRTSFNFHGFQGYDFVVNNIPCKLVKPVKAAKGNPWIIRARFWNHEPQVDIELLEHGFHVAYCDVADLYGSPEAVERWNTFYKYMRNAGFHKKVVLEGMSRGGLIVYNWTAANPSKVSCIYVDAPVLDIKSWPMGEGGSDEDTRRMMKAYGFKDRAQAIAWKGNPINHVNIIANARIPLIHVVGDADDAVPVKDNTAPFEKMMIEKHGNIKVIHKPDVGHHPHSLNNPQIIVDFILRSTGYLSQDEE